MTPPFSGDPAVLFLYLRTGGGHFAPARAVSAELESMSGGRVQAVLVDGLERAPRFGRWILEDGYRLLQARARWFYEFLYLANKIPIVASFNARLVAPLVTPWLRSEILRTLPRRIVVVHFLLIEPVLDILREEGLAIPVTVLVTDPFTAHPLWFRHASPDFMLFSDELRRHAVSRGIPAGNLRVFPFALSARFSRKLTPDEVREERLRQGFRTDGGVVLILGGADGIPGGGRIFRTLVRDLPRTQIVIVCGRNTALLRAAQRIREHSGRTDVTVFGFVDFAYELISCADVVISKCGASTFMEILLLERIPVITSYLWEQEKGNRDFLVRTGTGYYEPRPWRLAPLVSQLLDPGGPARDIHARIRGCGLRNGAADVAQALLRDVARTG